MRLTMRILAAVLLAATLAGCGEATPDAQPSDAMAMAAEARSGKGTGTVTAVDADGGTVTIEHGPMPAIGWSAMTMTFTADPGLLADMSEGDKVAFDVTVQGSAGTITALTRR